MKVHSMFLSVLLLASTVSGCTSKATPTAKPAQPTPSLLPTAAPTNTVEPAQNVASTTSTALDPTLPALLSRLHWLGNASFRLDGPPVIYFDPILSKNEWPRADVILISHSHGDHYSPEVVKSLSTANTVIITCADVAANLQGLSGMPADIRLLKPGEKTTIGEVEIAAVPAYNVNKSYHPKEAGNLGFVVTLQGETLYFAGDTDRIPEMANIRADVALLPIGGTYTMDAQEAALAAADIQPKVVVPMHNLSTDPEQFRSLCKCTVVVLKPEN